MFPFGSPYVPKLPSPWTIARWMFDTVFWKNLLFSVEEHNCKAILAPLMTFSYTEALLEYSHKIIALCKTLLISFCLITLSCEPALPTPIATLLFSKTLLDIWTSAAFINWIDVHSAPSIVLSFMIIFSEFFKEFYGLLIYPLRILLPVSLLGLAIFIKSRLKSIKFRPSITL